MSVDIHSNPYEPFRQTKGPPQPRPLTKEEMKVWNDCLSESLFKGGIPFAIGVHFISNFMKKGKIGSPAGPTQIISPIKSVNGRAAIKFVGNVFFGIFLYSPICYNRLKVKFMETQETLMQQKDATPGSFGSELKSDDTNFQGHLDLNYSESDNNFSHLDLDLSSNVSDNLVLEEEKSTKSVPENTYENLRRRNRESFGKTQPGLSSPPTSTTRSEQNVDLSLSKPSYNEPPPRKVIKNKYGDEIES